MALKTLEEYRCKDQPHIIVMTEDEFLALIERVRTEPMEEASDEPI